MINCLMAEHILTKNIIVAYIKHIIIKLSRSIFSKFYDYIFKYAF